jgi:hypothetical protein
MNAGSHRGSSQSSGLALAQDFAVHLASWGLWQLRHEGDVARVFVLAELGLDKALHLVDKGIAACSV